MERKAIPTLLGFSSRFLQLQVQLVPLLANCNIQLCFPTPGPQEVTAEARQLPLDYIGDQVRHKSTFIFISIISSNQFLHNGDKKSFSRKEMKKAHQMKAEYLHDVPPPPPMS